MWLYNRLLLSSPQTCEIGIISKARKRKASDSSVTHRHSHTAEEPWSLGLLPLEPVFLPWAAGVCTFPDNLSRTQQAMQSGVWAEPEEERGVEPGAKQGWTSARAWKSIYESQLSVEHVQGRVCGMTPALRYRLVLKGSTCIPKQLPT